MSHCSAPRHLSIALRPQASRAVLPAPGSDEDAVVAVAVDGGAGEVAAPVADESPLAVAPLEDLGFRLRAMTSTTVTTRISTRRRKEARSRRTRGR